MSIVERMAHAICEDMGDVWELAFDNRQQQRVCKAPDGSFRDINRPQKGEYIETARAALRAIKPEDVTDRMRAAWRDSYNAPTAREVSESVRESRAIAAAIAAGAESTGGER